MDLPLPNERFDGGIVIASVWLNDDVPNAGWGLIVVLEPSTPYYRVCEIAQQHDEWKVRHFERFPNIVPAIRYYVENGGDY